MQETWAVTPKGYDIAVRIYRRFIETLDPIEQIAADDGLTVDEARVLMFMVESGGIVVMGEDVD